MRNEEDRPLEKKAVNPITLFTGQWAGMPLEELAEKAASLGYDGLELACWGDHFSVAEATGENATAYCAGRHELLAKYGLRVWAISAHLVGQAVCDPIDLRHKAILPEHIWGDGDPEGVRRRATQEMMRTAKAAANLGVKVVNGFTGSKIWPYLYSFPPVTDEMIEEGYLDFARRWKPIIETFALKGIRFALEVHPTEIAYDVYTAGVALQAIDGHLAFGFNFDPSHLRWQGVDPLALIKTFPDRIFHVHLKDVRMQLDGTNGIVGGHLPFGDVRRPWEFCSIGRGNVNFPSIIRALNAIGYKGPLSIEWEDPTMDREFGADEAIGKVREWLYPPAGGAFDAAFSEQA